MDAVSDRTDDISERDHFIPVRKIDVMNAVIEHGGLPGATERDKFRQFCRLLAAIYHYQYFERLERLRNDYFYFSPDLEVAHAQFDAATLERAYKELIATCESVLDSANFIEIPHDEVHRAHREHALVPVEVKAPLDQYREVRFFRRGHHRETIEISQWFGWRKRHVEIDVYDDVVLLVSMKPPDAATGAKRKRSRQIKVRPGAVLLKYFRDIARADLDMLFPDVRVVMGLRDQLWLGVPALVGGIPILIKLASTITVLLLVAGFYLGVTGSAEEADTAGALAALGGLIALGGFVVQQWIRFQRQSLMYQKTLSDNVYFRNINNNAGIFDYIVGEAEEQECKEAFLAYYFLLASEAPSEAALDQRIEAWLRQRFGADIDFEGNDALAKLDRLGLLRRDGDRLAVLPLDAALVRLDQVWDNFFPYTAAPR